MGSDQPENTFEAMLAAPDEQFDPEGVILTGVLREIETEVRQEAKRGRDERPSAVVAEGIAREIEQFRDRSMRDTTVDTDRDQVIIETYLGALDEAAALARRSGGLHGLPPGTGRSAVDPTVPVVEAEEAARLGVRAEVLLVGRILAER